MLHTRQLTEEEMEDIGFPALKTQAEIDQEVYFDKMVNFTDLIIKTFVIVLGVAAIGGVLWNL